MDQTASEIEFDAQRRTILDAMLMEAPFEGWTDQALQRAGTSAGLSAEQLSQGHLKVLFPQGPADILDFWAAQADHAMMQAYATETPTPTRIRDKVTFLVRARIEVLAPHREAARRAASTLALPHHAVLAQRLTWRTADAIWRALGDTSTDFNHYTKRMTLSAVYLSTLATWFADEADTDGNDPFAKTWAFLDKRIENVMQFEKVKAQTKTRMEKLPTHDGLMSLLAKMRYREH